MEQFITFEGEAEYLVVDTSLTQDFAPLMPSSTNETHSVTDALVILKHKQQQQQQQQQHTLPDIESCGFSALRTTEAPRTEQQQQHFPSVSKNIRQSTMELRQLPITYKSAPTSYEISNMKERCLTTQSIGGKVRHSGDSGSLIKKAMIDIHDCGSTGKRGDVLALGSVNDFYCFQCKLQFNCESNVVAHFKSAHSRITCHHCRLLKFDTYISYRRHVKESHIACFLCHAMVKHKTALQKHLSRYHPDRSDRFKINCGEPDCGNQFINLLGLTIHLKVDHNLPIVAKTVTVASWEAAQQWIVFEELFYNVKFVVRNNYRSGNSIVRKYWCDWNGLFQRGKEMRESGRSRVPQCVAFCTVDVDNSRARYVINACLSHYGHRMDTVTPRCSFRTCDQVGFINHYTNSSIRYFKPAEEQIVQQWLSLLSMREKRDVLVCSRHFVPRDFDTDLISNMLILKPLAIPSVFGAAAHMNDPFNDCACEHSNECSIVRENKALRARVAVLEGDVARLQQIQAR
ncbi:uncharacterized protein LOC111247847 isoform X2 [Varroa destructor]|uniref:THAP-type domain-containing protein n=1 Tax=Varroa destructor TaxID=109461 RepID=A0A7M7JPS9_VARDE|nr:uncharacterized protein LOC111247847 isoform X2 [Varroa destructor]